MKVQVMPVAPGLTWSTGGLDEGAHVNEDTNDASRPGLPWFAGDLGEETQVSEDTGDDSHTDTVLVHMQLT
ncbi:hypothetical protein NDU88_000280 [Pleurodeles waltl]|uniref:Uncharacterized protein n=1 Tax=Pleurodeles waltl TaxID=8319 RepID=A0AAV7L616_PLEWA|nr:hypothetical protein NDU88_000280 [Pleurodeles waltl]